jgi:peptidyl-prolyl cis-trans isomerase A (cyclophilin A)
LQGKACGFPRNFAEFVDVKSIPLLILCAGPLHAELLATFETTKGNVTAVLQYDKAPQAVANFITLAQGARSLVNPVTGSITYKVYYTGEKFFRVVNDPGFKIIQTGSGTGTNSGGPSFSFRDEFHANLTHVPYVLSMANSGPNTNSSQIFFTGSTTTHSLDGVHTIFGLIPDTASRTTIDAILAAGNDATTITGVTISRTDPAAVAFDESAQNIPTVICPRGRLDVVSGISNSYLFDTPLAAGDVFRAYGSTTLAADSWISITNATRRVGLPIGTTLPSLAAAPIDNALEAIAFYNLSVTRHPGAVAPDNLANRTITMPLSDGTLTYLFNSTGTAGITTFTPTSGSPFGGPFTVIPSLYQADPNNIRVCCDTPAFLAQRYFLLSIGCDTANSTHIVCRHNTQFYNYSYPDSRDHQFEPFASGALTISR